MNLVEKILARASGKDKVEPGEVVVAKVDRLIMHDLSGYLTSKVYEEKVGLPIPDPKRVVLVFDHHFSPPTEHQAEVLQHNRSWARKHGISLFDCGSGNIHHVAMRRGMIQPGMIVVGSDSHTPVHGSVGALAVALGNDSHAGTVLPYGKAWFKVPETVRIVLNGVPPAGTTARDVALWLVNQLGEGSLIYKALEFSGPYIKGLSFWDRWLFPLLCVDLGAKCGFVEPDDTTRAFVTTLPGGDLDLMEFSDAGEAVSVPRVRCVGTGSASRLSADRRKHQTDRLDRRHSGSVRRTRRSRRWPDRGHPDGGGGVARTAGPPGCAVQHRSVQPRGLQRGAACRAGRGTARGGSHLVPGEHRIEPGREHGGDGRG